MRTRPLILAGLLLAAVAGLSTCGITIDEGVVFRPEVPVAARGEWARPAPLAMRGEAELTERFGATITHELHDFGGQAVAVTVARVPVPDGDPPRPLIVSCSGNASDRPASGTGYAAKLLPHGDAVLWDYPGYGDSAGEANVASVEAASNDLMAWVEREAGGRELVLWGHSLGGFVCAQMASRSDAVDAVVLETTARNVEEVGRAWRPLWLPVRVRADAALSAYDTADALADFGGRVLVLGAGRDRVLPVELHRSLAAALPRATYLEMPEATHYSAGYDPRAVAAVGEMLGELP